MVEINLNKTKINKKEKDGKWAIEFEESIYPLSYWGRGINIIPIDKNYAWIRIYQFCSSEDFPPQCEGSPKLQIMYSKKIFTEDVEPLKQKLENMNARELISAINKILTKGTIHL